jgi:UDP-N-acetylglucosamine--N-acetylmuramyl-(pentapeptide) pyrophosphoryl-undecaprenol N-acetylglucosamine transferase
MAELRFAYTAADVVISRAGSGSIFEISAFGRASILVPLEGAANDHQKTNAYAYSKTGAAVVVEKDNFTPHIVELEAREIIETPGRKERMESAAKSFARPESARVIADEIVKMSKKH